jgi:cation transport ATPase
VKDRNGVDGPGDEGLESSVAMVAVDGQLAALVRFRDTIKTSARAMVRGLRAAGIAELILATGDHEAAARAVSRQLDLQRLVTVSDRDVWSLRSSPTGTRSQ